MEIKSGEIAYFKHVFESLIRSINRVEKKYYIDNPLVIYHEFLTSFSRICSLLYANPLTPKFIEKFITIYQHYYWILNKINVENSQFLIPSVSQLNHVIKKLMGLIKKIIPLFNSSQYPINAKYYADRVQNTIEKFKLIVKNNRTSKLLTL